MNNGLTNTTAYALASLDDYLFVGTGGGGVFRSTDDGESWNPVSSGTTVYALLAKDSLMLQGTASFGVLVSRDSGSTWVEANQGLTNFAIVSLASDDQYLYAGTLGSGVFRRPLNNILTSIEPASSNIPGSFRLEQNFPNPFNPVTTISYALPAHTHVTLTISDVVGREVARLVDEFQEAGYKSVAFDGSTLSSGVYFYRIQAGSFLETKRLILMK